MDMYISQCSCTEGWSARAAAALVIVASNRILSRARYQADRFGILDWSLVYSQQLRIGLHHSKEHHTDGIVARLCYSVWRFHPLPHTVDILHRLRRYTAQAFASLQHIPYNCSNRDLGSIGQQRMKKCSSFGQVSLR